MDNRIVAINQMDFLLFYNLPLLPDHFITTDTLASALYKFYCTMENITVFNTQSAPVPYALFVDRHGILTSREVREKPLKRERRPAFPRENELIQPDSQGRSLAERENLKKDVIFKMLLNDQNYAEAVVTPFLRAFWGHLTEVKDLRLKTLSLQGSTKDSRAVSPDVVWQSQATGDVFLIEMQRRSQDFYSQRLSLYDGKLRVTLAEKGSGWDYNQVSVFVIGLADFDLQRPPCDDYIYEYVSMNPKDNKDLLTGRDWKILADLKNARTLRSKNYTEREKWIYLLNNFHKLKRIPAFLKEGYFENVIKIAKNLNRTKMEELMDLFWENLRDDVNREKIAKVRAEGEAKGRAKGRAEGRAEGVAEGLAKGMNKIIKYFISAHPSCTIQDVSTQLGVEEQLVRSVFPG